MFALLLFLILSADAKTPTSTVQAARAKLMQVGEHQKPFTVGDSTTHDGVSVSMTITMHGWEKENIPCPVLGAGEMVTVSYVVATNGMLPTMGVTANVKDERTGKIIMASVSDVFMDGTVEIFSTLDGTDLKNELTLGQAIYDAGLQCFVPSPTAFY